MNGSYDKAVRRQCRETAPALHFATTFGDAATRTAACGLHVVVRQLRDIVLDTTGGCCGEGLTVCANVLDHLYAGKETGKPQLDGFADLAQRHGIERDALMQYVEALAATQDVKRYATWARLRGDFERTEGALLAHVIDAPQHLVMAWVAALQSIDAAMHLPQDWRRGRLRIPLDDLVAVKLTLRDVATFVEQGGGDSAALHAHLSKRIESLYRGGMKFMAHLPVGARRVAAVYGAQRLAAWQAAGDLFAPREAEPMHRMAALRGAWEQLKHA